MNYQFHYDKLISTRKLREPENGVYYEKHHIVPKSMGGSNDESNIIYLTAREHFLAHWLLWRIHRNRSMAYAFSSMCRFSKKQSRTYSSRGFAEAREAISLEMRELGKKSKGRKHSPETLKKMKDAAKGRNLGKTHTTETKAQMSLSRKGRKLSAESMLKRMGEKRTDETKARISSSKKGKIYTDEMKKNMSDAAKRRWKQNNNRI